MPIHNDLILSAEMIQNSSCYTQVGLIKWDFDARAQVAVSALLSGNCFAVRERRRAEGARTLALIGILPGFAERAFPFVCHVEQRTALKQNSLGVARNVIAFFFKERNVL